MTPEPERVSQLEKSFLDDESRWLAFIERNPEADGSFLCAVKTTGIYCRPTCPAKRAFRKNVSFYATCREAEAAGYRPCRRCKPNEERADVTHANRVAHACRLIETSDEMPTLEELADAVGMSRFHFHRLFKAQTGLTPKSYARAHRTRRVRAELTTSPTVTGAIYGAGFQSNSRFYETSNEVLGMTPKVFRAGGSGTSIRYAVGASGLGSILVAASARGVCAIFLGDSPEDLVRELQGRFPKAELIGDNPDFEQLVAQVVSFLDNPSLGLDLPLDIRGTAFQQRVWETLRQIPLGSTVTYTEIARLIGQPKSVRAVANACGANTLAVVIPCHRVIRTDGSLSGYRWGVDRKSELLRREKEATDSGSPEHDA